MKTQHMCVSVWESNFHNVWHAHFWTQ